MPRATDGRAFRLLILSTPRAGNVLKEEEVRVDLSGLGDPDTLRSFFAFGGWRPCATRRRSGEVRPGVGTCARPTPTSASWASSLDRTSSGRSGYRAATAARRAVRSTPPAASVDVADVAPRFVDADGARRRPPPDAASCSSPRRRLGGTHRRAARARVPHSAATARASTDRRQADERDADAYTGGAALTPTADPSSARLDLDRSRAEPSPNGVRACAAGVR